MRLCARGLSVYKQRPSILGSCLDAASERGQSSRNVPGAHQGQRRRGKERKKCTVLRHIIVWGLAELSASVLHSRPLDPLSNAVVFFLCA